MQARTKTTKHADQFYDRAGRLATLAQGTRLDDIDPGRTRDAQARGARILAERLRSARLTDLTPERIQAALALLREAGKSHQTVNHYRAALRAFVRWAGDNGRLRDNPMRGVKGFNVEEDRRHERRSLTDDELARLIRTASSGPTLFGMPGPLRSMAYRLAAATGFRAEELRNLTPEAFRLDCPEPSAFLVASTTKNRRPAEQPIPFALARDLTQWLRDKPAGVPVLPLHHETAKAIRADLTASGIPYETDKGVADFHSLRAYFVSALVRSGATIKEVQTLARHAKPQTTLSHYAKVSVRDLRGAVESLPSPPSTATDPEPAALAATGTDGPHIKEGFAPPLPHYGDRSGRTLSDGGGSTEILSGKLRNEETPETSSNDGVGRVLSAPDGFQTERGGFEPPKGFDTLNGLANRRFRPLSHLSRRSPTRSACVSRRTHWGRGNVPNLRAGSQLQDRRCTSSLPPSSLFSLWRLHS